MMTNKTAKIAMHYTERYLIDPPHPVTINIVGCGGTGSQVISTLGRMNSALKALNHPGLFIRAIDPDRVTTANMGRQLFSESDVDMYKCSVLIGRVNRFFGTDWEALPVLYRGDVLIRPANITISCVDTGAARKGIKEILKGAIAAHTATGRNDRNKKYLEPYELPYYWMDFGNMKDRGQMVMGTMQKIEQPKKSEYICRETMATVDVLHPEIFKDNKKDDQGPSCSMAEALGRQDLLINTNLANIGLGILWKMFRELRTAYNGIYVNQDTMCVNPIKIK